MTQMINVPMQLQCDFAVTAPDNSMVGAGIRAGDIVYFSVCSHAENGQIVAVKIGDAVRLLRAACKGTMLVDCPLQGHCQVFRMEEHSDFEIIGRAVGVLHIFEQAKKGATAHEEK